MIRLLSNYPFSGTALLPFRGITLGLVLACLLSSDISLAQDGLDAHPVRLAGSSPLLTDSPVWDGRMVGCAAARNWQPSVAIEQRRRTLMRLYCDEQDPCVCAAVNAMSTFLHLQAERQRDVGAATALKAYYSRIAVAEQLQILQQAETLNKEQANKQQALQRQGLAAQVDMSEFDRQKLSLLDQRIQLESRDRQLRDALDELTCVMIDYDQSEQETLEVFRSPLDRDRLIQFGLSRRTDLIAWQHLSHHVTDASAPIFAKLLGGSVAGAIPLPLGTGLKAILCPPDFNCLCSSVKQEIKQVVRIQSDVIRKEVRDHTYALELAYERIEIAKEVVSSWQDRLSQLEELDSKGSGRPKERTLAASALLDSKTKLIQRRVEARLAEVDLAESVGALTQRCCAGQPWLVTGYE